MSDPQAAVHAEFASFDWDNFGEFQDGIREILTNHLETLKESDPTVTAIPPAEKQQLIDQAKSFFYCTKTGNIINLDDYYAWKRNNGDKITYLGDEPATGANQASSNTEPTDSVQQVGIAEQQEVQETPYSSNYQELVNLIVSGKPVPGIKEIPDTVLSDQKSESHVQTRTKPWEKATSSSTDIGEITR